MVSDLDLGTRSPGSSMTGVIVLCSRARYSCSHSASLDLGSIIGNRRIIDKVQESYLQLISSDFRLSIVKPKPK